MEDRAKIARESYDCRELVAADLGEPKKEIQGYAQWLCPFHQERQPSFTVYANGYHCFGCDMHGSAIDWVMKFRGLEIGPAIDLLLGEELSGYQPQERRQLAREHKQIADEKRRAAYKLLTEARWHEQYAHALLGNHQALGFLESRGVSEGIAVHFGLGFRSGAPWGPAISIPWKTSGELRGIQYRIMEGDQRYRWDERAYAKPGLFNADEVKNDGELYIVEGAIKAMVMVQSGLPAVGLVNKQGWEDGWGKHLRHRECFICMDPDAWPEALAIGRDIGHNARAVMLPRKPDDLLHLYGWRPDAIREFASMGVVA